MYTTLNKFIGKPTDEVSAFIERSLEQFEVDFTIDTHQVVDTQTIRYGHDAVLPTSVEISSVMDEFYPDYSFVKWDKRWYSIVEDTSIHGIIRQTTFEVRFFDAEGIQIGSTQKIKEGKSAIAPENPSKEGYDFVSWDKDFTNVRQNLDIYPIFRIKSFHVALHSQNGLIVGAKSGWYDYNTVLSISAFANEDYVFQTWSDGETLSSRELVILNHVDLSAEFKLDTIVITYDEGQVPLEKDIIFKSTTGTEYKFAKEEIPQPMRYCDDTGTVYQPFSNCPDISSSQDLCEVVDENGNILSIGDNCFFGCENLSCVHMSSVTDLGSNSFSSSGVESVDMPNLQVVGEGAFSGSNIKSVLVENTEEIKENAFSECLELSSVIISSATVPPSVGANSFSRTVPGTWYTVWVNDNAYKSYLDIENWRQLSDHISSMTQPLVTFLCGDTILKTEKLNYGMSASLPDPLPTRTGYELTGWSNSYVDVSADISCLALWRRTNVTITYHTNWDPEPIVDNRLRFVAGEPNSTIKLTNVAGEYKTSFDGKNWTDYTLSDELSLLNEGDQVEIPDRNSLQHHISW